jgi:hypothetical protein
MRARTVYESLDFERGIDPLKAMDIGAYKNPKGLNAEDIANLAIKYWKLIVGDDEIPENVLQTDSHYLREPAGSKITDYLIEYHPDIKDPGDIVKVLKGNPFEILNYKFRRMGYKKINY